MFLFTKSKSITMQLLNMAAAIVFVMSLSQVDLVYAGEPAFLPSPVRSVSTVPTNGDVNPYGVAFVPKTFPSGGTIGAGDILVSNFNNSQNLQGTGTTIIRVPSTGQPTLFFQGQPGLGLTTALVVLKAGLVLVGNLPTSDGTSATAQPGSIMVLDKSGNLLQTLTDSTLINGPWDATVDDQGHFARLFISNVLSGTVSRLDLKVSNQGVSIIEGTQIASGYQHRGDPVTLEVGPTGLVYEKKSDTLFVASTGDNMVFSLHRAGTTRKDLGMGKVIYSDNVHLHGALAMVEAPNGHLLVSNSDGVNPDQNQPSEIVEFTKQGEFVMQLSIDPAQGGSFGLSVATSGETAKFAAVDDNTSTLNVWTLVFDNDSGRFH
ncbi:MAG: hypothetical protein ABSA06_03145 [Geobacteraceae bacterium]|jgi:hypothetical protein